MLPKGIVASGFPAVRETCRRIGVEFDPWQADLNRCLLAKRADGLYAADIVVLSIARQVGKTFDVGAVVFALCIANPGMTVIWTAHRFKIARLTFNELRALAKSPKLAPHIDYESITSAAGNECIPFRNGSQIVFGARERGSIRGYPNVAVLVLDEGQYLTDAQLSDLVPTTNQAENPLIVIMGTPPKPSDPGEAFTALRSEALAEFETHGHSESGVLFVEFSADRGSDPNDRKAWRKANPSYPKRTPARAILRMKKLLSADDFLREALGIWDGEGQSILATIRARWPKLADEKSAAPQRCGFAVDVSPDRLHASIGAAGVREGGRSLLFVVACDVGTGWVVPALEELRTTKGLTKVAIHTRSPAASLIPKIEATGIEVEAITDDGQAKACGELFDAIRGGDAAHLDDPLLNDALAAAELRDIGDGGWGWRRKGSANITPLVSVTLALWESLHAAPFFAAARR